MRCHPCPSPTPADSRRCCRPVVACQLCGSVASRKHSPPRAGQRSSRLDILLCIELFSQATTFANLPSRTASSLIPLHHRNHGCRRAHLPPGREPLQPLRSHHCRPRQGPEGSLCPFRRILVRMQRDDRRSDPRLRPSNTSRDSSHGTPTAPTTRRPLWLSSRRPRSNSAACERP
jgi:hypothetical protein